MFKLKFYHFEVKEKKTNEEVNYSIKPYEIKDEEVEDIITFRDLIELIKLKQNLFWEMMEALIILTI